MGSNGAAVFDRYWRSLGDLDLQAYIAHSKSALAEPRPVPLPTALRILWVSALTSGNRVSLQGTLMGLSPTQAHTNS
jgi:hypothetical protein